MIAIIGSGRGSESAVSDARELGRLVAERGWVLVTGGRDAGVMKAANEGARQAKESLTIGILPDKNTDVSPEVDVAIITDVGEARNNIIVLSADVVVACGIDDPGTASEAALAIQAGKPVVLLGVDKAARDFFSGVGGDNVQVAVSPTQVIEIVSKCLRMEP